MKITKSVENIISRYDIDDLIQKTIPSDYQINTLALEAYSKRLNNKPKDILTVDVNLSPTSTERLNAFMINSNSNKTQDMVLNFLIENVCDLSKIHTKDIAHALDIYYDAVNNNPELFKQILNGYAESIFYDEKVRTIGRDDCILFSL